MYNITFIMNNKMKRAVNHLISSTFLFNASYGLPQYPLFSRCDGGRRCISVKETRRRMKEQELRMKDMLNTSQSGIRQGRTPGFNQQSSRVKWSTDDAFQRSAFYSLSVMRKCGVLRKAIAEGNAGLAFDRMIDIKDNSELDALSSEEKALFVQLMLESFWKKDYKGIPAAQFELVMEILKLLEPVDANPAYYVQLINAYAKLEDVIAFENVWQEAQKVYRTLSPDIVAAMIRAYVNNGLPRQAVHFATHQVNEGKIEATTELMSAIVMAFSGCGRPQDGIDLYRRLRHQEKYIRLAFIKTLLHAISKSGHIKKIQQVLELAKKDKITLDTGAYNSVILAYMKSKRFHEAIGVFEQMLSSDMIPGVSKSQCSPDVTTLNTLLELYFKANNVEGVNKVWDLFRVLSLHPTILSYTIMMEGFRDIGDSDSVQVWFDKLTSAGFQPDVVTYSVIVSTLGMDGQFDKMEEIISRMKSDGIQTSRRLYHAILSCYGVHGRYDDVQRWFREMTDAGIIANAGTLELLIQAATLAKRPANEVEDLYSMAKEMDLVDDSICHRMIVFYLINGHSLSDAVSRVPLSPDVGGSQDRNNGRLFWLLLDAALDRSQVLNHLGHPRLISKYQTEFGSLSYPEANIEDYRAIQSVFAFLSWRNNGSVRSVQKTRYFERILPFIAEQDSLERSSAS